MNFIKPKGKFSRTKCLNFRYRCSPKVYTTKYIHPNDILLMYTKSISTNF